MTVMREDAVGRWDFAEALPNLLFMYGNQGALQGYWNANLQMDGSRQCSPCDAQFPFVSVVRRLSYASWRHV